MKKKDNPLILSIEERLGLVIYEVDKENKHIEIKDVNVCLKCPKKWCVYLCPANVYQPSSEGGIKWNYENCIECGSCSYICPYQNIECDATLKRGGFGISYRYG